MKEILVPIFICAILPIAVVLIVSLVAINNENKRAAVLIKAIEAGAGVDADKLAEALKKPRKSPREILNQRLLRGCICSFIGLALIAMGIVNLCSGVEFGSDPVTVPLMFGGITIALGISYIIVYFVTRGQVGNSGADKK